MFHAEFIVPSSATMSHGKQIQVKHHSSKGTPGPTHPQRPPFNDLHKTQWDQRSLEIAARYPNVAALAHKVHDSHPSWDAFEEEEIEGCFLPSSPAIIRVANRMGLFKTADEELEVEESKIES